MCVERRGRHLLAFGAGDGLVLRRCRQAALALQSVVQVLMCWRLRSPDVSWSGKVAMLLMLEMLSHEVKVCLVVLVSWTR